MSFFIAVPVYLPRKQCQRLGVVVVVGGGEDIFVCEYLDTTKIATWISSLPTVLELVAFPLIIQSPPTPRKRGSGRIWNAFLYFISVFLQATLQFLVWSEFLWLNHNNTMVKEGYMERNSILQMSSGTWLITLFLFWNNASILEAVSSNNGMVPLSEVR